MGRFAKSPAQPKHDAQRCHVVTSPACLIRGHHRHMLPVCPRDDDSPAPRPDLVALIKRAVEARDALLANRDKSVSDLANERRMTESHFARLVRINYLAPDIQTAILDGAEPAGLCQQKILNAAMLLDWKQQRELLGFGAS